jgi:hypothetical protein
MGCALDCCPLSVLLWCATVEMADCLSLLGNETVWWPISVISAFGRLRQKDCTGTFILQGARGWEQGRVPKRALPGRTSLTRVGLGSL